MKRLALTLLLAPGAAFAHPGDHSQLEPGGSLGHVLGSADHLLVLLALVSAGLALRPVRRALARMLRPHR